MNSFNERILNILKIASSNLQKKNPRQKSRHWKIYNYKTYNLHNLENFRNLNGLSYGLEDQNETLIFKLYSRIIEELSEEYVLKNLSKNNIGNSLSLIKYKNVYVDYNKLIHIHWLGDLEKNVLNQNIKNFCEIGGGFGSLAELIIKNHNIKLLSIDLPEANFMTSYYLSQNFPAKKFYLYDNYLEKKILSYEDFLKNDIIILPPETKIDEKIKIDFFINTRSMMEMNFDIIKKYFDFIHNYISDNGYFLNINRYEKTSTGEKIRISDYPYDKNWDVLSSKKSFNQDWTHFLITKRKFSNYNNNIKDELTRIRKIGEKYYNLYIDDLPNYLALKKIVKKVLKITFGIKVLNYFGKHLKNIGNKLLNIK